MKAECDFATLKSRNNPCAAKSKKPVTMCLSADVVGYFKGMAEGAAGVPCQRLTCFRRVAYFRSRILQNPKEKWV